MSTPLFWYELQLHTHPAEAGRTMNHAAGWKLLDGSAAALDENAQNNHKQYAGDNSDDRNAVHIDSSFGLNFGCCFRLHA
jgi:hypothetical protein